MVNMKNRILNHFGWKVLSLVIAILVWIIVANVDDYKTTKQISGVKIDFINGEAITEKNKVYEIPVDKTITIVVKGRRKVVEKLTSDDFKAVADLNKMSITNAVKVEVSAASSYIGRDLTISYSEDSVMIAVEDRITKQLPISVRAISNVAEGYAIRNKTATPNLITVEGAESVVNMIENVVVDVDVKDADHNLFSYAAPIFLDKNGNEIDSTKFTYDVKSVDISVEVLKTKKLAVRVKTTGEPKENYGIANIDYQPTSVLVVGEPADLKKVDEILIDNIDVTDYDKDLETSVAISDYLPTGIVLADNTEEVMIKVMIEKIIEKTITIKSDDINIVGKQEGYSYIYNNGTEFSLKIRGLKDDLENFKVTDLIPSIDVTEYGQGIYSFTINMRELKRVQILDTITVELEIIKNE